MKSKQINILQFVNSIRQNISKKKLIKPKKNLLLTISGGQDSICLCFIFYLLQRQLTFKFDLILCNHFWQTSSFFSMLHVTKLSYSLSSKIILVLPLKTILSEESARNWRYKITERKYRFHKYSACTQGHSKTDRIETILFNLFRGSGLAGISALRWKKIEVFSSSNKFYPGFSQFIQSTHTPFLNISEYEIALKNSKKNFQLPIYISQKVFLSKIETQIQDLFVEDQFITLKKNVINNKQNQNTLTVTLFPFLITDTFPFTLIEESSNLIKKRVNRAISDQIPNKLQPISDISRNHFLHCQVKNTNILCKTCYFQLKSITI